MFECLLASARPTCTCRLVHVTWSVGNTHVRMFGDVGSRVAASTHECTCACVFAALDPNLGIHEGDACLHADMGALCGATL